MKKLAACVFSILIVFPQMAAAQGLGAVPGASAGFRPAATSAAPPPVAAVVEFDAPVEVTSPGSKKGTRVRSVPFPLERGMELRTGPRGSAVILFHDMSRVRVDSDSDFVLRKEEPLIISLWLGRGKLWAEVSKIPGRLFGVVTPASVAAVRGTQFSVQVLGQGKSATEVYQGAVEVQAVGRGNELVGAPALLHPGDRIEAGGGALGRIIPLIAIPAKASAAASEARRKAIESAFRKGQDLGELKGSVDFQKSLIKGRFERMREDQGASRGPLSRAMEKWSVNREIALSMKSSMLHLALGQGAVSPVVSPASMSAAQAGYMRQFAQADMDMRSAAAGLAAAGVAPGEEKLEAMAFHNMAMTPPMMGAGGALAEPPTQGAAVMMQYSSSQPDFYANMTNTSYTPPPSMTATCTPICNCTAGVCTCTCQ